MGCDADRNHAAHGRPVEAAKYEIVTLLDKLRQRIDFGSKSLRQDWYQPYRSLLSEKNAGLKVLLSSKVCDKLSLSGSVKVV